MKSERRIEFKGQTQVASDITSTWAALNDPDALQYCIKQCDRMERLHPNRYRGRFRVGLTRLKVPVGAELDVEPVDIPRHYRLSTTLGMSLLGKARGEADVRLSERPTLVLVDYTAVVSLSGHISNWAPEVIEASVERNLASFFTRMQGWIESGGRPRF